MSTFSGVFAFLHELWVRFTLKSPKFAKKVQIITGFLILLIPSLIALAQQNGLGWDTIMISLYLFKVSLNQLLGFITVFLIGVFGQAGTSVEDRHELKARVKKRAPSAKRIVK